MASRFADHPEVVHAQVRLIAHTDPTLLRQQLEASTKGRGESVFRRSPSGQWLVDRSELERAAKDDSLDSDLSLQLAHLIDALRHCGRQGSRSCVPFDCARWHTVTTGRTLRTPHGCVENAGFFAPLSTVTKSITHILSKVINIRCQARKFSTVTRKYIAGDDEASHLVSAQLRQLILCSLLGNYAHVPASSRVSEPARTILQQLVSPQQVHRWYRVRSQAKKSHASAKWSWVCKIESSPVGRDFVLDLIQHCPLVVTNALRDFLIHVIRHDAAQLKHLNELMRLDRFESIVTEAMTRVRSMISSLLPLKSSCLRLTLSGESASLPASVRAQCLASLEAATDGSHKRMLDCSYRRPDLHVDQFLLALLKHSPMVPLPESLRRSRAATTTNTSQQQLQHFSVDDDNIDAVCLQLGSVSTPAECAKALRAMAAAAASSSIGSKSSNSATAIASSSSSSVTTASKAEYNALDYVTPEQWSELQALFPRLRPSETHVMSRFVPWLKYFGVQPAVLQYILLQFGHFHQSSLSTERLKKRFSLLRARQPHAYNLLQLCALMVRDVHKHNVTFQLPMHLLRYQMSACQSSIAGVDQKEAHALLASLLQYVYCNVCGTVYSLLRDYKSVYRKAYSHGLRDVSRSYCSGLIYCRRGRVTSHGQCNAQPLRQMLLLGRLLLTGGKLVMLCPQPGCCAPMVIDADRCVFNSIGVACKDCSERMLAEPPGFAQLQAFYSLKRDELPQSQRRSGAQVEEVVDDDGDDNDKASRDLVASTPDSGVKCDMCAKWLESLVGMVIIRRDLHLCTAHCAKPHVIRQLHEALISRPHWTKQQLLRLVHESRNKRHDERAEAAADSQRHSLARLKQRNRSKRKR